MTKMFVKKPYLTLVAIVIVLTFGGVSLSKMQTNLMPDMEMPYLAVITTEMGASPQKVQDNVTKPVEDALGTISGVNKVSSTSSSNYGMTMLEFSDDTDMDAALVRVSKALNSLDLPDDCGTPNLMEISADMMATMAVSVGYDGKDIKDVTAFTDKVVIPYLKRQNGVASITETGNINDTIEVRLNQKKIDKVNEDILMHTNKKLRDAQKKIDKAKKKLDEGNAKLKEQEGNLSSKQENTTSKLAKASVAMNQAQAMKASYESSLTSLKANKTALMAEKKAYNDAKIPATYKSLNGMFKTFNEKLGDAAKMSNITIPTNVKDAINHPDEFNKFKSWLTKMGQGDSVKKLTVASMKKVYDIAEVRMPQINTELANLKTEIKVAQAMVDKINEKMKGMDKKQEQAVVGGYQDLQYIVYIAVGDIFVDRFEEIAVYIQYHAVEIQLRQIIADAIERSLQLLLAFVELFHPVLQLRVKILVGLIIYEKRYHDRCEYDQYEHIDVFIVLFHIDGPVSIEPFLADLVAERMPVCHVYTLVHERV